MALALVLCLAVLSVGASPAAVPAQEDGGGFCDRAAEALGAGVLPLAEVPEGSTVGAVDVRVLDVFDAGEDGSTRLSRVPYRLANRFHVNTRPSVIERQLLFASGDPFDPRALEESERRLRRQTNVYDACIAPVRVRGRVVDVLVVTRDVWTLGARASFGRSGQANTVAFGAEDSNFLGTGRAVALVYSDDPDRTERRVRYQDPALYGTRAELALKLAERSDGHRYTLDAGRPFFSFDTRWSATGRWVSDESLVRIYSSGEVTDRFVQDWSYFELRGGLSRGYTGAGAHRFLAGFTWDDRSFRADPGFAGSVPTSRTLAYPWLGWQWVEDGYVERSDMDLLTRTEDWNLGAEVNASVGWSSTAWGADSNQAVVAVDWSQGVATRGGDHVIVASAWAGGRLGDGSPEHVLTGARVRHYFTNIGRHRLFTSVQFDAARDLDPESQLLLGGDNGLRGYPMRFRDGDRRLLASIEQRFYTDLELLDLFHVGGAIFLDVGRAWYAGDRPGEADETLRDIGIGLRLGSSRSSRGTMVHLDVAFPLDGDRGERRGVQWLVTTKESF